MSFCFSRCGCRPSPQPASVSLLSMRRRKIILQRYSQLKFCLLEDRKSFLSNIVHLCERKTTTK